MLVVDYNGKSGRLALWKDDVTMEIINYSINKIHVLVTLGSTEVNREQKFVLMGVYGHPKLIH